MTEGHGRGKLLPSWYPGRGWGGRRKREKERPRVKKEKDRWRAETSYILQRHSCSDLLPPARPPSPTVYINPSPFIY
jgi:hypothetical protein